MPQTIAELLDEVRRVCRLKHLSLSTETSYTHYIRHFVHYHGRRHPSRLGAAEVSGYLSHLAVEGQVAAATQNVAFSALLFLYRDVLQTPLPLAPDTVRAKSRRQVPVVFSRPEMRRLLRHLASAPAPLHLMASLLYGAGLRLMECVRLRVKDVDFDYGQIIVRDGKGHKDRRTMLPAPLAAPLRQQIEQLRALHQADLQSGCDGVYLPDAFARKYRGGGREFVWQWLFPSARLAVDPRGGAVRRHHVSGDTLQRAVKAAVLACAVDKRGSCHTLRHSFATHLLEAGYDIRT